MELDDIARVDVSGKQLDGVLRHSRYEVLAGIAAIVLAVAATGTAAPAAFTLGWAAFTALAYAARFAIAEQQKRRPAIDGAIKRRSQQFLATVIITSLCWGALVAYLLYNEGLATAVPVLILACTASVASLGTHTGFGPAGIVSALATLLPPIVVLVLHFNPLDLWTAMGLAGLAATTVFCARLLHSQLWEAAALRERNQSLVSYLDQRRDQVEKLNVEVKTTQAKREQAELSLRRTSADLGLIQGKAKALADTLERISPHCQVTGLSNRRHFDQTFDSEWRRAARENKMMSICIVDIDEYDDYVETYGRQAAETLLKRVATVLKGFSRRSGDTTGRYEDTKLALLLPGCELRNAMRLGDALRKRIEGLNIPHANAKNKETVTVHIGVAMIKPSRSMHQSELLKRVDTALYEARFQGGNRVVSFQPLSKLKIDRWDAQQDGPLNDQSLMQKLLVWGYDTSKLLMPAGTKVSPEIVTEEKVIAISSGEMKIEVEGHAMNIKPGDCIFIPRGVELALEVVGERQVLKYSAIKNK
jgi:diguanylate cyclase (GGDEF)-like protein